MIEHNSLGINDFTRRRNLKSLIDSGKIKFGGNKKLKIVGTLKCGSGKRMKITNRVFFESLEEAITLGYRRCGNCMRSDNSIR
jgi:hypothetical protein